VATIKAAPAALISSRCRAGIGANEPLASALSTSCARVYALTAKTIARIPYPAPSTSYGHFVVLPTAGAMRPTPTATATAARAVRHHAR
jgi:hypothetical protein